MKLKCHKIEDVTDDQLIEETGFHVWGSRIGLNVCTYDIDVGFRCIDYTEEFLEFIKTNPNYREIIQKEVEEELKYLIELDMVRVRDN